MAQEFKEILETVAEGRPLDPAMARDAMQRILDGQVNNEQTAAFLYGMRVKGETVEELTSFVQALREAAIRVEVDTEGAVDLCGTGGDNSGTFNISTAAMFVAAGAGVPVLKHGNRSVSSRCGSADVLEELGVVATLGKRQVEEVFAQTGIAFMFAPNFHPAMKHVMPARRALGIRTFFNILGPLLNPAQVTRQVVGAYSSEVARVMIQILENVGADQAWALSSHDGLDELSITSGTDLYDLQWVKDFRQGNEPSPQLFDPRSLGLQLATIGELEGGDAVRNAAIIRSVLDGTSNSAQRDVVLLNASLAIQVSGRTPELKEALGMARDALESGAGLQKLEEFAEATRQVQQQEPA